jgi:hypothetical protein
MKNRATKTGGFLFVWVECRQGVSPYAPTRWDDRGVSGRSDARHRPARTGDCRGNRGAALKREGREKMKGTKKGGELAGSPRCVGVKNPGECHSPLHRRVEEASGY